MQVCTCSQQKEAQALFFSKVSSTENVLDLNLMLRFSQNTLNIWKGIYYLQREGEWSYCGKNSRSDD